MRLSTAEIKTIVDVSRDFAGGALQAVYLHGSRVDDTKRGGDIDLVLVVADGSKVDLQARLHYFLADLKTALGPQRIDVTLANTLDLQHDPFLQAAMAKSARLH